MIKTGIFQDEFEIVTLKHIEYILTAKMRCEKLIIGISDPDSQNLFTYYEKMNMIRDSLLEFGIKRNEFEIVPFPVHDPEKLSGYVEKNATVFMNIYNENEKEQCKIFEDIKLKTKVLWRSDNEEQKTIIKDIKKRILNNEEWEQLVPESVYKYALRYDIESRLKK